jgi:hypothetical protein
MVRLTSLEETLFEDEAGLHRERLIDLLLTSLSAHGGDHRSDSLRHAAEAAREVIETLWSRYHGEGDHLPLGDQTRSKR